MRSSKDFSAFNPCFKTQINRHMISIENRPIAFDRERCKHSLDHHRLLKGDRSKNSKRLKWKFNVFAKVTSLIENEPDVSELNLNTSDWVSQRANDKPFITN